MPSPPPADSPSGPPLAAAPAPHGPPAQADAAAHRANMRGIAWMIAAMAAFAVEDALLKTVTRHWPIGQVLMGFGAGGAVVFAVLALRSGAALRTPPSLSRVMRWRAACEFVGRLFYMLAIALTPLSSATAILQATPLVVVLGAVLLYRETVGWSRWLAIFIGLAGVLIVLRPAAGDFSWLSLLAVIGTLGFAGRDLASRAVPMTVSTWVLGLYGFTTVVVAGSLYAVWDGRPFVVPTPATTLGLAAAVAAGVTGYASLMKAMRTGSIAVVTPFRYTRLLFGISLGAVVFGERPDGPMLLGCAVIIGAGLFIWWQGRRKTPSTR